jgi:hypothetical protein
MPMRKGRETYGKKYDEAMAMHQQGKSVNEIAAALNVSYSAAYHWVKGLRKPEKGNVNEFEEYLRSEGPLPVIEVEKKFPKHNELFLMANRRGLTVKRHVLKRKFSKYSTWYYLDGQEEILERRLKELFSTIDKVRKDLSSKMF